MTSVVVRTFGWMVLLSRNGLVSQWARAATAPALDARAEAVSPVRSASSLRWPVLGAQAQAPIELRVDGYPRWRNTRTGRGGPDQSTFLSVKTHWARGSVSTGGSERWMRSCRDRNSSIS